MILSKSVTNFTFWKQLSCHRKRRPTTRVDWLPDQGQSCRYYSLGKRFQRAVNCLTHPYVFSLLIGRNNPPKRDDKDTFRIRALIWAELIAKWPERFMGDPAGASPACANGSHNCLIYSFVHLQCPIWFLHFLHLGIINVKWQNVKFATDYLISVPAVCLQACMEKCRLSHHLTEPSCYVDPPAGRVEVIHQCAEVILLLLCWKSFSDWNAKNFNFATAVNYTFTWTIFCSSTL